MAEGFDFAGTASGALDQACFTAGADGLKRMLNDGAMQNLSIDIWLIIALKVSILSLCLKLCIAVTKCIFMRCRLSEHSMGYAGTTPLRSILVRFLDPLSDSVS